MVIEEAVAGVRVHVKRIILTMRLERLLELRHMGWSGTLVVLAKEAEQRTGQVWRVVDGGHGLLGRQLVWRHHHTPAPAIDSGVKARHPAGGQEGLPTTGTGAKPTDLTLTERKGAPIAHRSGNS